MQVSPPQQPAAVDPALDKALAHLEKFKVEQERLIKLISDMRAAPAPLAAASSGGSRTLAVVDLTAGPAHQVPTVLGTDDIFEGACNALLPQIELTEDQAGKAKLSACGHMYHLLLLWNRGGCLPVSFGQLRQHSLAGSETHQLMKMLIGEVLWEGWFCLVGDTPDDTEPIPRQALSFIALALDGIKAQHESKEEAAKQVENMKAAAEAFMCIKGEAKRRRVASVAA